MLPRTFNKRLFSSASRVCESAKTQSTGNWQKHKSSPKKSATSAIADSIDQLNVKPKANDEKFIHGQYVRRFNVGSTYDPFDFSLTKIKLDRNAEAPAVDQFKAHKMDPVKLWKNPVQLSEFITDNGQIIPGYKNGHRKKTQKRLAKAIRRARAAGLISSVHKDISLLPK